MRNFVLIALAIVAGVLIYSNWDKIKENLPESMKLKKEPEKPSEATTQVETATLVEQQA